MKQIDISTNKFPNTFAMVDDEDYPSLIKVKWFPKEADHGFYAASNINKRAVMMHRYLMNAPADRVVDHIDGDGLNNTRANLRICTRAQNSMNQRKHKTTQSSAYKGVSLFQPKPKYRAYISVDGKRKGLGYFDTELDAAKAYNAAAVLLHGEYAHLNDLRENT